MRPFDREQIARLVLTLVILLSGAALIPFVDLEAGEIDWDALAGVYEPVLSVNETSGAPGSTFAFTGSDYPPNSRASVFVDGTQLGSVETDSSGVATFMLKTPGADPGQYDVVLEADSNASAMQGIELVAGGALVTPPDGFPGPVFLIGDVHRVYLPLAVRK